MSMQWLKEGHSVDVVTCLPNHPTGKLHPGYRPQGYQFEELDGLRVHRNWTYLTPNKGLLKKSLGHLSYLPSAHWNSLSRLKGIDVAIGTSPTFFAAMAAAATARRYRVPFIMEVRDLWPSCFVELGVLKQPLLIKLLERWELSLYRRADRIVTVTESFRKNLIARGVRSDKITTIYNGADEQFWKPRPSRPELRKKLNLESKFVVLYIGAHGISQALTRVLEAARRLSSDTLVHFLFVGEGAEKAQLMQQAAKWNLSNVTFLKPVAKEEVAKFYSVADVCLVPLRKIDLFRAFIPSKIFEMMAMKKPILASLEGEAAEILEKSGGAVVVPPEDSGKIAQAILRMKKEPQSLVDMGERGREFVTEHFSRRTFAAKYLALIEQSIEEKLVP